MILVGIHFSRRDAKDFTKDAKKEILIQNSHVTFYTVSFKSCLLAHPPLSPA